MSRARVAPVVAVVLAAAALAAAALAPACVRTVDLALPPPLPDAISSLPDASIIDSGTPDAAISVPVDADPGDGGLPDAF